MSTTIKNGRNEFTYIHVFCLREENLMYNPRDSGFAYPFPLLISWKEENPIPKATIKCIN